SASGSTPPPADSVLITGMPKIAVPIITSTATAMTRRGAAMASRAIPDSTSAVWTVGRSASAISLPGGEFMLDQFAVDGHAQQFGVGAGCLDPAALKAQDLVGVGDGGKSMSNHEETTLAARLQQVGHDVVFVGAVEMRGWFIHEDKLRPGQECTSQ